MTDIPTKAIPSSRALVAAARQVRNKQRPVPLRIPPAKNRGERQAARIRRVGSGRYKTAAIAVDAAIGPAIRRRDIEPRVPAPKRKSRFGAGALAYPAEQRHQHTVMAQVYRSALRGKLRVDRPALYPVVGKPTVRNYYINY